MSFSQRQNKGSPREVFRETAKRESEHDYFPPSPAGSATEREGVRSLDDQRRFRSKQFAAQHDVVKEMSDTPSRTEIAAQLQAAEARTETRIAQLSAAIEARSAASDHKIDLLVGKMDVLSTIVLEVKGDSKNTKTTVWLAALAVMGLVVAGMGLVVALWVAGLNTQNNLIAVFQAGLGVRSAYQDAEPRGLPAAPPPSPTQPIQPGKTK